MQRVRFFHRCNDCKKSAEAATGLHRRTGRFRWMDGCRGVAEWCEWSGSPSLPQRYRSAAILPLPNESRTAPRQQRSGAISDQRMKLLGALSSRPLLQQRDNTAVGWDRCTGCNSATHLWRGDSTGRCPICRQLHRSAAIVLQLLCILPLSIALIRGTAWSCKGRAERMSIRCCGTLRADTPLRSHSMQQLLLRSHAGPRSHLASI